MDQEFANQVKMEWEMEKFNEALSIQATHDRKDDDSNIISNNLYNEIIQLKKNNKELGSRLSTAEFNIKKLKKSNSVTNETLVIVSNEMQKQLYENLYEDSVVTTFDEFIKKFEINFQLETANHEVTYYCDLGMYDVNKIETYLTYDKENNNKIYFTIDELLEDLSDEGDFPIKFVTLMSTSSINTENMENDIVDYIIINDAQIDSLDINVSYSLDIARRKFINDKGFIKKTIDENEYLDTEYIGMIVDDLNSDANRDNDILYNYIYFKLSICGYDVSHKIMNFKLDQLYK